MKRIMVASLMVLLMSAPLVLSQPMPDDDFPGPPPPPEARGRMQERFRTMQIWKLTEVLELSEQQADKFIPLFRNFQKEVDSIRDENEELFNKLDGYVKTGEKEQIDKIITSVEKNEQKILDARAKFRLNAGKILDPVQIGKLVLFQREFPKRFRDAMWEMRGGGQGKPGKRGPDPGFCPDQPNPPTGMRIRTPGEGPDCPYN